MSDSTNLSLILEILTSQKVYDETTKTWRVYDANGLELVDSSGILMQGLHGFLLREANQYQAPMFASLGGVRTEKKQSRNKPDNEIESPLTEAVISRIGDELLAGVLADEVISRAKRRKARAEEEALLLMI